MSHKEAVPLDSRDRSNEKNLGCSLFRGFVEDEILPSYECYEGNYHEIHSSGILWNNQDSMESKSCFYFFRGSIQVLVLLSNRFLSGN